MLMILLTHILIALISVIFTTLVFIAPTKSRLQTSMVLVGLTLASGTYLVLSTHSHMIEACTMGLIYTGASSYGILAARQKLAGAYIKSR